MIIDTHTHCREVSRCATLQPEALPHAFEGTGIKAIVLTNHCYPDHLNYFGNDLDVQKKAYVDTYERVRAAGAECGIKVLFGCELRLITMKVSTEFLLFGLTPEIFTRDFPLYNLSQRELYDYCNANDLLMFQTHPFRIEHGCRPADLRYMHGLEAFNGHRFDPRLYQTRAFADSGHIMVSAGSDLHAAEQAGRCGMEVDDGIESSVELCDYIRRGLARIVARRELLSSSTNNGILEYDHRFIFV